LAPSIVPLGTGAVVTPDYSHDDTQTGEAYQPQAFAEWRSEPVGCPADALEVVTGVRTVTAAGQAQPNTQPVVVTAVSNTLKNQPFFIVVP
jgi:hypothetical protein